MLNPSSKDRPSSSSNIIQLPFNTRTGQNHSTDFIRYAIPEITRLVEEGRQLCPERLQTTTNGLGEAIVVVVILSIGDLPNRAFQITHPLPFSAPPRTKHVRSAVTDRNAILPFSIAPLPWVYLQGIWQARRPKPFAETEFPFRKRTKSPLPCRSGRIAIPPPPALRTVSWQAPFSDRALLCGWLKLANW